jgi:hypothetical protein
MDNRQKSADSGTIGVFVERNEVRLRCEQKFPFMAILACKSSCLTPALDSFLIYFLLFSRISTPLALLKRVGPFACFDAFSSLSPF